MKSPYGRPSLYPRDRYRGRNHVGSNSTLPDVERRSPGLRGVRRYRASHPSGRVQVFAAGRYNRPSRWREPPRSPREF